MCKIGRKNISTNKMLKYSLVWGYNKKISNKKFVLKI